MLGRGRGSAGHADLIRLVSGCSREMSARYGVGCMHDGSYTEVSSHRFSSLLTIHGEHLVRKWSEPEVVVCSGSTCEMSRKVKETGGTCAILRPGPSKVKYER